jgi:hypothetical protein
MGLAPTYEATTASASSQRDKTFPTSSRPAHGAGAGRPHRPRLLSSPRLAAPGGALGGCGYEVGDTLCGWGGRLHGFSHLPDSGPAPNKTRGPLVQIPGRFTACPSCRPAYGPLIMLDPKPGRTPAKAAPPTSRGAHTAIRT